MSEVKSYLRRLVASIVVGIVLMAGTAIWAWNKYAGKLQDAPPLPTGAPPLSSVPLESQ
jgi:hypothetical protein